MISTIVEETNTTQYRTVAYNFINKMGTFSVVILNKERLLCVKNALLSYMFTLSQFLDTIKKVSVSFDMYKCVVIYFY